MDPWNIIFVIPIVAIVLGVGRGIVIAVLQTWERVHMAKLEAGRSVVRVADENTTSLRDEIAKLRDTSTQHAISLQHSVERLEQRVEFLERKSSPSMAVEYTVDAAAPQQIAGRL